MASPNEIKFLSQKIKGCSTGNMSAPQLLRLPSPGTRGKYDGNSKQQRRAISSGNSRDTASKNIATITVRGGREPFSWGLRIDVSLIPKLPTYYILEPKSTMTLQEIPVSLVESRISEYLRLQSISFSFCEEYVRLDCDAAGMLKFTVQFWQLCGNDKSGNEKTFTVELQRRQGSVIEMQKIRRELFNFIMTGQKLDSAARQRQRVPPNVMMTDTGMNYDPEEGRKEALEICLRLLESPAIDQVMLGLESLAMMTNASVVSREDAVATALDIVYQTTELGRRLSKALTVCFGISTADQPMVMDGDPMECAHDAYFEQFHSLGLKILVHALQLVIEEQSERLVAGTFDISSHFWVLVAKDLCHNVERAVQRPHEACMSAKCMRLLSTLKGQVDGSSPSENVQHNGCPASATPNAFRSCLEQAHRYGQKCHYSLEMESQKLLAMDVDHVLLSH